MTAPRICPRNREWKREHGKGAGHEQFRGSVRGFLGERSHEVIPERGRGTHHMDLVEAKFIWWIWAKLGTSAPVLNLAHVTLERANRRTSETPE